MPTKQSKELVLQEMTLQQMVDKETSEREILVSFISHHMKKGTDYAAIHISKNCDNKYNCTNKYHFSKDSLTKAGAEKIGSLLRLRPDVVKDADTWEMSGSKQGLFCYRCNLYNRVTNQLEGMGLGACSIEEKGSANNAIKIAKKRAFVDAILSTGALSDFFTQDMEDMSHNDAATPHYNAPMKPYVKSPTVAPQQTEAAIDDAYTSYARETTENGVQAIVEDKYGQMSIGALKVEVSQQMNSGKIKKDYAALSKATKEELIETLKNA